MSPLSYYRYPFIIQPLNDTQDNDLIKSVQIAARVPPNIGILIVEFLVTIYKD